MSQGTFQKIEASDEKMYGPPGMIVCGYPSQEHKPFAVFMDEAGFAGRPIIFVKTQDADRRVKSILGLPSASGMGEPSDLPRALILSGFTQNELHTLMAAYRRAGLPGQLWATLTPTSENWTLRDLLAELAKENEFFKGQKQQNPSGE